MNSDVNQIDRIVREVIRRLQTKPSSPTASLNAVSVEPDDSATLRIDDRVVTGDLLSGRLDGVRRVEVPSDAVVTPLVIDLLKEKKVELQRANQKDRARRRLWLLVEQGRCRPDSLLSLLKTLDVEWRPASDWKQLLDAMSEGDIAVVVTPLWAARVCQANRRQTVRAVHVVDSAAVQQAVDQANANMLIINAAEHSESAAAKIAREFVCSC